MFEVEELLPPLLPEDEEDEEEPEPPLPPDELLEPLELPELPDELPWPPPPPLRFSRALLGSAWEIRVERVERRERDVLSSGIAAACAVLDNATKERSVFETFMFEDCFVF